MKKLVATFQQSHSTTFMTIVSFVAGTLTQSKNTSLNSYRIWHGHEHAILGMEMKPKKWKKVRVMRPWTLMKMRATRSSGGARATRLLILTKRMNSLLPFNPMGWEQKTRVVGGWEKEKECKETTPMKQESWYQRRIVFIPLASKEKLCFDVFDVRRVHYSHTSVKHQSMRQPEILLWWGQNQWEWCIPGRASKLVVMEW